MTDIKTYQATEKRHAKKAACVLFCAAYACFFSLAAECFLSLFDILLGTAIDGWIASRYPRFIPFCLVTSFAALIALVGVFLLDLKASKRLNYTKKTWCIQLVSAFVISLPAIVAWEILFNFLQKTF